MAEQPMTAEQLRAAQEREYGTYVAVEPIDIDGTRAFNPGHKVPISHVEGYPDPDNPGKKLPPLVQGHQVAKVTTKAGREAAGLPAEAEPGKS